MNEIRAILDEVGRARGALATVVRTEGSAYRRPGAKMLVTAEGRTVGTLSGGCLEQDVAERAREVIATGAPRLVRYDTTASDDLAWGLGLGCNGVVEILVESIADPAVARHLASVERWLAARETGVVATVFAVEGETGARVGARVLAGEDGAIDGTVLAGELAARIVEDAAEALALGRSAVRSYDLAGGRAGVFLDVVEPPVPLVVFGGGHDAVPLVALARSLGWHVTLVDHRAAFATRERFPEADEIVVARPESVGASVRLDHRTVAVLMTHNYTHDLDLLATLLPSPARYVGALGPKSRTERLLRDLESRGVALGAGRLDRLHAPVGIDIGAETPAEIAVSIVAEIRAVVTSRRGGFLKDRSEPIHARPDEQIAACSR